MCAVSLRYIKAMTNNSIFVNPHLPVFASIVRFGITLLKTRNKYSFTLDYITLLKTFAAHCHFPSLLNPLGHRHVAHCVLHPELSRYTKSSYRRQIVGHLSQRNNTD